MLRRLTTIAVIVAVACSGGSVVSTYVAPRGEPRLYTDAYLVDVPTY